MADAKPHLKRAKEAFGTQNYVLAAESLTRAINAGSATAGLYADRALALIGLGSYTEAVEDANKCIDLDPTLAKGYTRKGGAFMKLKQYRAAREILQLGSSRTGDASKFVRLLERCEKSIAEEANQFEDAPMSLIKPKYSHYYYNKPNKIILVICAMGVPNDSVIVHFGEDMLNVSVQIPGEKLYQFQPKLPSKIIPHKCHYQILPKEVVIHLEKAEESYWNELIPQSSMLLCEDHEFSWVTERLHGQDILPHIRDQKKTDTCVFQTLSATGEMELKRKAANQNPPKLCDIKFCTDDFVEDYERLHGPIGSDDTRHERLKTGLAMFIQDGVTAEGTGVPKAKYRAENYEPRKNSSFSEITELIEDGRPVLGSVRLTREFGQLKPGEIYDPDPAMCEKNDQDVHMSHAVVFIGHGVRDGRAYLVFLNSFGTGYCDGGFGRVYFDRVRRLTTLNIDI